MGCTAGADEGAEVGVSVDVRRPSGAVRAAEGAAVGGEVCSAGFRGLRGLLNGVFNGPFIGDQDVATHGGGGLERQFQRLIKSVRHVSDQPDHVIQRRDDHGTSGDDGVDPGKTLCGVSGRLPQRDRPASFSHFRAELSVSRRVRAIGAVEWPCQASIAASHRLARGMRCCAATPSLSARARALSTPTRAATAERPCGFFARWSCAPPKGNRNRTAPAPHQRPGVDPDRRGDRFDPDIADPEGRVARGSQGDHGRLLAGSGGRSVGRCPATGSMRPQRRTRCSPGSGPPLPATAAPTGVSG